MSGVSLGGLATGLKLYLALLKEHDEAVAHPRIEHSLS
jgi:predicted component of type VI protein secretion system